MDPTQCSILMIRRKDSMSFTEFLRGKYSTHPPEYLGVLLSNMTQPEQQMIRTQQFDTLWTRLWGYGVEHHYNEYPQARQQFDMLDIETLLDTYPSIYTEPEWGFPKGRRNYKEKDLECALREFEEETGYNKNNLIIIKNLNPFEEIFTGSNLKSYKHKYFLTKIEVNDSLIDTTYQKSEIGDMKWFSYEECLEKIRDYNIEKIQILNSIHQLLKNYNIF